MRDALGFPAISSPAPKTLYAQPNIKVSLQQAGIMKCGEFSWHL
jgi:hypothetical protein